MDTNQNPNILKQESVDLSAEMSALFGEESPQEVEQAVIENDEEEISLEDEVEGEDALEEVIEDQEQPIKKEGVKDLKQKVEELEKQKIELEAQSKLMKKRMKALSDFEEKYKTLVGEGYDVAHKIVQHRKNNDFGSLLKEVGVSSNDLIDYFQNYLKEPEQIKVEMKKQEEAKRAQILAEQERKVQMQSLAFDASKFIAKYEDKLPIIATLGDKGVDQVINTALQLRRENSPLLAGCRKFEDVLKVVLPKVEKQLRKEYEPIVKRLSSQPQKESSKGDVVDEKVPQKEQAKKSQPQKLKPEVSEGKIQKEKDSNAKPKSRVEEIRERENRMKEAERELKRMFSN